MAYTDVNTPVIEQLKLPSGNNYYIADREIRDVVQTLSETIAGGVSFVIAWDGASTPTVANIPEGVVVTYNGTTYTGTLSADNAQVGAFYLVKSATTPSSQSLDIYDEYIPVGASGSRYWEKIGDTTMNLTDVVTGVSITKSTDSVIGSDSTFTITQPTIALATGATAGTGVISVATGISSANVTPSYVNAVTALGTPSTDSVIGANATFKTTQPTITLATNASTGTGRVGVATGISSASITPDTVNAVTGYAAPATDSVVGTGATFKVTQPTVSVTPTTTYLSGSASGGAVAWNSKDATTVVTDIGTSSTSSFLTSATGNTSKLVTTSIAGVSGSNTASKATAATSQTTATGGSTSSSNNTDWLKGLSVSNGVLTISAATMNTQTTTQYTFSDVSVPKAASAITVATGSVASNGTGSAIVTSVTTNSSEAITALGTVSTDSVVGANATFNFTQPTITLATNSASATGRVKVATGISSATATGGAVAWNSQDATTVLTGLGTPSTAEVLGNGSTITVTPTTTYIGATATGGAVAWNSKDATTVLTGLGTATTDSVLGSGTTISVTPTTTNVKATASGANTAWKSKDAVTVLTSSTTLSVVKGT